MNLFDYFKKIERTLGGLKFAVVIILLFAIYMTVGTFQESYHGAEYANRLIYKSIPFMLLQFLMFLSILFATTLRLPPRKQLYGFYVLHAGLLTIFIGSFVTYKVGIDGNLTLMPNTPAREVELSDYEFNIYFEKENKKYSLELPFNASETRINRELEDIKVIRYLPFANKETQWFEAKEKNINSTHYKLYNDRFAETFYLSMHPDSDYDTTLKLGLLALHYMPSNMARCFGESPKSEMIIWDSKKEICETPEELKAKVQTASKSKNKFLVIKKNGELISFFPDLSPLPIDKDKKILANSTYRIFSLKLFKEKPHLFLFGDKLAYYDVDDEKWLLKNIDKNIELPWMGFKINTIKHSTTHYPKIEPTYVTPIQDGGKLIKGGVKAIELELNNQKIWVTDDRPIKIMHNNRPIVFSLENKKIKLPYEIILDKFKMDTDPGTMNPASYESFVSLFDGKNTEKHHVFMNNPLKHKNFTFYQASYFELQKGYGSVFSVNYDPGRAIKYFGCILLVFGSIWHFLFRNRKRKKHV